MPMEGGGTNRSFYRQRLPLAPPYAGGGVWPLERVTVRAVRTTSLEIGWSASASTSSIVGAVATIVSVNGSIPSFQAAKLLVREDGSLVGTIGGGCVEAEVWNAAREVIEDRASLVFWRWLEARITARPEVVRKLATAGFYPGFAAETGQPVRLDRPADLPSIVSSPTFAIVPKAIEATGAPRPGDGFVGSGPYRLTSVEAATITLEANERYWAGTPAIGTVTLVTDLGGRSPVEAFADDELDIAPVSRYDASWIAYDAALGPALVEAPSLTLQYYGFDTTRAPFDDVRVRQAFAKAVDWARIVTLASNRGAVARAVANSIASEERSNSRRVENFSVPNARSTQRLATPLPQPQSSTSPGGGDQPRSRSSFSTASHFHAMRCANVRS